MIKKLKWYVINRPFSFAMIILLIVAYGFLYYMSSHPIGTAFWEKKDSAWETDPVSIHTIKSSNLSASKNKIDTNEAAWDYTVETKYNKPYDQEYIFREFDYKSNVEHRFVSVYIHKATGDTEWIINLPPLPELRVKKFATKK